MPGMSILHMACSRLFAFLTFSEQFAILSLLLSERYKLDINLRVDYRECTHDIPNNQLLLEGMTPFMLAIHHGVDTATLMLLREEDINLNLTTKEDKNSALHLLFSTSQFQAMDKLAHLELIIERKPNITKNSAGKTPLDLLNDLLKNQSNSTLLQCKSVLMNYMDVNPGSINLEQPKSEEQCSNPMSDPEDPNNLLPKPGF